MNALFGSSVTTLILVAITFGASLTGGVVGARVAGPGAFARADLVALAGLAVLLLA